MVWSIWDATWTPNAKILRDPQNPVKSLIVAYPEALKSRIQDNMVLTGREAAQLPADTWALADTTSCWGKQKCELFLCTLGREQWSMHHPMPNMPFRSSCSTTGPQHRLLWTSFVHRYLFGIFQIYFSLPSSCLFTDRYGGGSKITSQGFRGYQNGHSHICTANPHYWLKYTWINSDSSHLQIKEKQKYTS